MTERHLVVFVHGWGANRENWWGSTQSALACDARFQNRVRFYFHGYDTKGSPDIRCLGRIVEVLGLKRREQELGQLGGDLWSVLRLEFDGAASIALFGHSYGGLVVADAIRYGVEQVSKGLRKDEPLLHAINAVALCCTPVAGADLASKYNLAVRVVGENKHVLNLRTSSKERQDVVNAFLRYIKDRPGILTLFRATGDGVVKPDDLTGPFSTAGIPVRTDTLEGNHSDCVQNISSNDKRSKANFEKITRWIEESLGTVTAAGSTTRGNFSQLLDRLKKELEEEPFRSWTMLRKESEVDDVYLFRIFLQQLVYLAAHAHEKALGSANLWVAHFEGDGSLHLRSEEREGFFATGQLVVFSGTYAAGGKSVTIRANEVHKDGASLHRNSAGAKAYVTGNPELVAIASTDFPSRSDRGTGITHILGVPLHTSRELNDVDADQTGGAPLAITIDFRFDQEPSKDDVAALTKAATEITSLFRSFQQTWVGGRVRYKRAGRGSGPGAQPTR